MSIRATATFNLPLTTFAQGIAQDRLAAYRLANLICPIVQVPAAVGTYKKFDDKNSFLIADTARPLGGPRQRLQFEAADGTYNCKPHGLEISKDDFESSLVGATIQGTEVGAELLDQGKIKSLISRKATTYAKRVVDFATANLTAVPNRGNWSNNDVDPIDQIDEQLDALSLTVGTTENIAVIISVSDWRALRMNAQVKKRLNLKPEITITKDLLVGGLLFPVQLEITGVSFISAKFGQTGGVAQTKTRVTAGSVLIVYNQPNPTTMDASAFKCFSTSSVLVDSVKTYREESNNSDVHAVDWSEDIEQTGSACAKLLAIT